MRNFKTIQRKTINSKSNIVFRTSLGFKLFVILILVIMITFYLFHVFNMQASPRFVHLGEVAVQKYIEHVASDYKLFGIEKNQSDSFMEVKENSQGEIIAIDYDMEKIYLLAEKLKNYIEEQITNLEEQNISYIFSIFPESNGFIIMLPMGSISESIFLANLGPKIPVMIRFIGSVFSNVQTKVSDYGINNALLEVYLDISLSYEIITPVTMNSKNYQYELLLDSKVIQGSVPNIYGGYMNSESSFLEVPFDLNV